MVSFNKNAVKLNLTMRKHKEIEAKARFIMEASSDFTTHRSNGYEGFPELHKSILDRYIPNQGFVPIVTDFTSDGSLSFVVYSEEHAFSIQLAVEELMSIHYPTQCGVSKLTRHYVASDVGCSVIWTIWANDGVDLSDFSNALELVIQHKLYI